MHFNLKEEKGFKYIEVGSGKPIIILHGLMGALSNFDAVCKHLSSNGYKVFIPELPVYELPILKTNVKNLSNYIVDFMAFKSISKAIFLGNSLGGHVALYTTNSHPELTEALVLTGSSGLYEKSMGDTYPKRGDYNYIKTKTEEVFYDPNVVSKELVDDLYDAVNNRNKVIRILALAKIAIRHNMSKDLPKMNIPACLIWGKNDTVTPPEVAEEFHQTLPDSDLYWLDKCGHAPMMEHPKEFNSILTSWLTSRNL